MTGPIRLDVFSDYLCPWCYNAAVRLADVQQAYGDRVKLHWHAFPLIPDQRPGRLSTEATRASRQKIGAEEPRALFVPPGVGTELPASSLPALTAAKAAEGQGPDAGAAFHLSLFRAHFRDNLDIGRPDVLWRLGEACGLDMARFQRDCAGGEPHRAVLHDYAEAVAWFGVSALPTVVFNERVSLVGAVPLEQYGLIIDWMLAGKPGGLIPLDFSDLATRAAGQSPVGEEPAWSVDVRTARESEHQG
ncbi:MAG: DsbA family oxidoreductase [Candidatus Rokuibacteriota bacterium]